MLAWQTERFTELATSPVDGSSYVVSLRPEQVVEVAFDGVQRSGPLPRRSRAPVRPGACATATTRGREEADTLETVRDLLPPS